MRSTISRYSIENYLLDPLVVYGSLLDIGVAAAVSGFSLGVGEEHKLRALPSSSLQPIADSVLQLVEDKLGMVATSESARHDVPYTSGVTLALPRWLLFRQGHSLMTSF